jgi:hypothetical protein
MAGERYTQEFKITAVQQGTQFQTSRDGLESPLKAFTTGEQGTAIVRQNMNLTKLKKAS